MQTVLFWSSFFLVILNHCPFLNGAPSISPCPDNNLNITGGIYTLSKVNNHEIILRYICEEGFYPSVKKRVCFRGQWNPKPTKKLAECKKVTCPNPNVLENGDVQPFKRSYVVNDTTTYKCYSDFTFRGSATRVCQPNGKWSGGTPICSHNNNHCPDPGIPPGMTNREGHIFDIDDKVTYNCQKDLKLIGSKVRVCLDGGYWSGKEPECYADFTYDTPEEVAEAFSSSLKTTITMHEESEQTGKKINLDQNGKLDIYIALDASDSIDEADFNKAKEVIKKLINKISYYEVRPNYDILIFSTDIKHIVNMTDFKRKNSKLLDIFKSLDNYNFEEDRKKTGTNIRKAYESIRNSISFEKENNKKDFPVTQHVVIMFTDGIANMGGDPKPVVDEIRQTVQDGKEDREIYLDLYAFGVGSDVEKEKIDEWVTKRYNNEKYFFMLQDLQKVEETLDEMIDESTSMPLCGLYKDYTEKRPSYPWMISITVTHENNVGTNCVGSLVTPRFILTAAHCFKFDDDVKKINLLAHNSKAKSLGVPVEKVHLHPGYNITGKKKQQINESYEYDVALIQLKQSVKISPDIRTICIPCTVETNRALQLSDTMPCVKQREMLFNSDLVKANFIKHDLVTKPPKNPKQHVLIKKEKGDCLLQAQKVLNIAEETAKLMITENFLCTGGVTKNSIDEITCKGDSGGPIFLESNRLIQVGVISWGLMDICSNVDKQKEDARDFHINLFDQKVQEFLEKHLGNEDIDTPLHFI
ncbi:complement factor B-like [Tachysurus vachellii]|uniref:complement factor B-like n=1 Tax=Tachysurus vachellii TaxID=175792 RepID=UPI00296AE759|nr:complement factor B-like [Tachysurus vachellii]